MSCLNSIAIHNQQSQVAEESQAKFGALFNALYSALDALLLVQYAFDGPDDPKEPSQRVQSFSQRVLYTSIFSAYACLSLTKQGFYTQSITLIRGLMESLVTVIFLVDSPADIDRLPRVSQKVKPELRIRERFDRVIPGYYVPHYRFLTEFTHPGHASHVLKVRRNDDGSYSTDTGIVFNEEHMGMCLNELAVVLAGFLKAFTEKFKDRLTFRDDSHRGNVRDARLILSEHINGHVEYKGENDWHRSTRFLWDYHPEEDREE